MLLLPLLLRGLDILNRDGFVSIPIVLEFVYRKNFIKNSKKIHVKIGRKS
jgi:hypothetical protein